MHGIVFKGVPAQVSGNLRLPAFPALVTPASQIGHPTDYFNKFFESNEYEKYVTLAGNGTPEQVIKVGNEYKVSIVVIVQSDALRERLEADGVIRKLAEDDGTLPTIMVVPSDRWCIANGYYQEHGTRQVPDYEKALAASSDLNIALSTVNEMFAARGYRPKNLEASLKSLRNRDAERQMHLSSSGAEQATSPLDELRRVAHADIWVYMDWTLNSVLGGSQVSLTFRLEGLDAYTDKHVAGANGTGSSVYTAQAQLPIMLEEAIVGHIEVFSKQMIDYFEELKAKGREVTIYVSLWDKFEDNLLTEYGGDELIEIIENWFADNTVNGKFNQSVSSPTSATFEGVRIPLHEERNGRQRDIDARTWLRGLKRFLADKYHIDSVVDAKGLGGAEIIIGEKL